MISVAHLFKSTQVPHASTDARTHTHTRKQRSESETQFVMSRVKEELRNQEEGMSGRLDRRERNER